MPLLMEQQRYSTGNNTGLLLPVVALVTVMVLLVIATMITDTETACSIRWVLGTLLIANVVSALELITFSPHIGNCGSH